jgi:alpha-L-fucosidase
LKTKIASARLLKREESEVLAFRKTRDWVVLELPCQAPEKWVSVIELRLEDEVAVDPVWGIDPTVPTEILAEFADVEGAQQSEKRWMEKFGEWKSVIHAHDWGAGGQAVWEVDVIEPGDYNVELTYAGEGRLVWSVSVEGGETIQNQQNSSHNYQTFPIGWIHFSKRGRTEVAVSCLEGNLPSASLKAIRFCPVD